MGGNRDRFYTWFVVRSRHYMGKNKVKTPIHDNCVRICQKYRKRWDGGMTFSRGIRTPFPQDGLEAEEELRR